MFRHVQKAFRESVFVSLFITTTLYLQGMRWLTLWNGAILLLLFILYISFSLSVKKNPGSDQIDQLEEHTL